MPPRVPTLVNPFCALVAALGMSAHGEEPKDLSSSAARYGEAMVQHWLIVDLAQQAERAVFYAPETGDAEVNHLSQSLGQTEEQLDQARELYKKLYKKEIADHLDALDELLNIAIAGDAQNAREAESLLTRLGRQSAGNKFKALPVSNAELDPAWDPKLIGKNFQPKRILFGSTGKVGDDQVLPLRFDFGSGVFSFYVPMEAQGKLAVSKAMTDRTDAIFPWMQKNHAGYHYWAGVYNNQNTYVTPWFSKEHGKEDDVWMRLIDGKIPGRGEWGQVNIWNPSVQSYLTNYCETQGRTFKDDPFLVCYDYTGEPHPYGAQPVGQPQYSGYNDSAVAAFRNYLRKKFKTIEHLNDEWSSAYKDFENVIPPPDPYVTPEPKATALGYEFRLFRCESQTQVWKSIYDAYRKSDPKKPIEANISQYMSGWPVEGLDAYGMQKRGAADWVDMHMNNFKPNLAEQIYLYSLCRLTGKVPVQFEYIWTFPRATPFDDDNESDFRTTCTASVWRNLAWGKKVMVFFDFYYDWPAYHNAFLDRDVGYSILRPSGCVVPVTKRKAFRFNPLLIHTEVVSPPIIVLQPDASVWNSPSLHPNQSFSEHINAALRDVHAMLFPKNYPFLYVPEAAVLEDRYDLSKHKVIILPQAPYLPAAMTDKLLAWVKNGGTLVALGVPGIWTPQGKDDMRLVTSIFGKTEVKDREPGKWKWDWKLLEEKTGVESFAEKDKTIGAAAPCGKGCVLIAAENYQAEPLRKLFFTAIDRAIGIRPASCAKDSFELVLREDNMRHRYLFILNPQTREIRQDTITLAGNYRYCSDLGVGSGVPVPGTCKDGRTTFELRLHPGEGTVIELRK